MSQWRHAICDACAARLPDAASFIRLRDLTVMGCCYCGASAAIAIWLRDDPRTVPCRGTGRAHDD
jgi:hypothetical protein